LLFLTISVSATFTIFYGFTFGKEKSEKWITSTLLSFIQDLMLLQPLKVFAAATFIALIIKDPNKVDQGDKSDNKPEMIEQVLRNFNMWPE
jgi:polycystin 1L2